MTAMLGTVLGTLRRFCRGDEQSDEATFSALRALAAVVYDGGIHCIKVCMCVCVCRALADHGPLPALVSRLNQRHRLQS